MNWMSPLPYLGHYNAFVFTKIIEFHLSLILVEVSLRIALFLKNRHKNEEDGSIIV